MLFLNLKSRSNGLCCCAAFRLSVELHHIHPLVQHPIIIAWFCVILHTACSFSNQKLKKSVQHIQRLHIFMSDYEVISKPAFGCLSKAFLIRFFYINIWICYNIQRGIPQTNRCQLRIYSNMCLNRHRQNVV